MKRTCLRPECGRQVYSRGLCRTCYGVALFLVKRGQTNWALLESEGKSLPPTYRSGGARPVKDWFLNGALGKASPVAAGVVNETEPRARLGAVPASKD